MKRRDFLKLSGMVGAGAAMPWVPTLNLFAAHDGYTGPLWLTVEARGGWDPTSMCDPKGSDNGASNPINDYPMASIGQIGNILYAPPPNTFLPGGANYNANLFSNQQFFERHYQRLLVINGIHYKTNSHSDGQRTSWSGELARTGYPNFGALVAGSLADERSIPFISNGGYSATGGLVASVRMNNTGIRALYEIAYPNRTSPQNAGSALYHSNAAEALIKSASAARQQALLAEQRLLRIQATIASFIAARQGAGHIKDFADNLANVPEKPGAFFNGRGSAQSLYRQGRIALAAYETGVTAAAHLTIGGFDTHSDHDARHYPRLMDFLQGIDAIIDEAVQRGLADRVVIVIGSDFGRTNKYNNDNGKDHWPVTSVMFWAAPASITGNRVIGQSTNEHRAVPVNRSTLQPDAAGVELRTYHIHHALRNLAGVIAPPEFRLPNEAAIDDLGLFS